ncbi:hypothetical protein NKI94_30095 [Mesorhizobium australicum]|uniref:hypothetical protein n=1 Tax=Mesorhizobium australicum TaxID=536018 RepID=UPI003334AB8E
MVERDGYAEELELDFTGQPLMYAPQMSESPNEVVKMEIRDRDRRLIFVKRQLDEAVAFLECFHDIDLETDEIEARYESESPEEEAKIAIESLTMGRHRPALPLSFDMLTRAIMAAEKVAGPRFESTLVTTARQALRKQEFINSFRYAFLLIEALYGEGQFKKAGLQAALKGNPDFVALVEAVLSDGIQSRSKHLSDTADLLRSKPMAAVVIDHLVEKRGFYFHGNVKRKDAWRPDEQQAAQSLALLTIAVAQRIAMAAANALFTPEFAERHFQDAMKVGAQIVYQIDFKFTEPEEGFQRRHQLNLKMPGTKVAPKAAFAAAQEFMVHFEDMAPAAGLDEAICTVQGTGEQVFEMYFHTGEKSKR